MTSSVIIWDKEEKPLVATEEVLHWRRYVHDGLVSSIPSYIEKHADHLRTKYLAFIHDLGEKLIDGKRVIDHLDRGDGFSFWWMTLLAEKSPLKSPKIYDCMRLLALEEILLDRKPSNLVLHSANKDLVSSIRQLCQNLQITFSWKPSKLSKQKRSLHKIYNELPHVVQGLVFFVRHILLRWPLRKIKKPQWFSGDDTIFFCSYFTHIDAASCTSGCYNSRLWGVLTKYLSCSGKRTNWIQHFLFNSTVPDVETGLGWLRRFNLNPKQQGNHAFLDTYLSLRLSLRVLKKWFWLNAASRRLNRAQLFFYPSMSAVWLWPMLRNDWLTSLKGAVAISNCLWFELFDSVLQNMPHQKIGLYLCENQAWEAALLRAWRRYGHGEIIGVSHSTVPFWILNFFNDPRSMRSEKKCAMLLPDRWAVNGMVAWNSFSETGYPVDRLIKVEALRYLNLLPAAPRVTLNSKRSKINILVLGDMNPPAMDKLLKLVEGTIKLLPPGYKFTFKPHPAYAVNLADYPNLQIDETSEPLDCILDQYDIVLAANSTSSSVDAYISGLPVAIMLDGDNLNLSPLRGHPGVSFVGLPEELVSALGGIEKKITTNNDYNDFFFMGQKLTRWQNLLSVEKGNNVKSNSHRGELGTHFSVIS